jgi:hypothetical protein
MSYTRRYLLSCLGYASGLGAALLSAARPAAASAPQQDAATTLRRLLDDLVEDRAFARLLGSAYRAQYPAESDPEVLTRLILDAVTPHDRSPRSLERQQLLPALDRRVRAEFGAGTTLQVGGWILALTEARLCALCA